MNPGNYCGGRIPISLFQNTSVLQIPFRSSGPDGIPKAFKPDLACPGKKASKPFGHRGAKDTGNDEWILDKGQPEHPIDIHISKYAGNIEIQGDEPVIAERMVMGDNTPFTMGILITDQVHKRSTPQGRRIMSLQQFVGLIGGAVLLDNMGKFMGHQFFPLVGMGLILTGAKDNMIGMGISKCLDTFSRFIGQTVGMKFNATKISVHPGFEKVSFRFIELLASRDIP